MHMQRGSWGQYTLAGTLGIISAQQKMTDVINQLKMRASSHLEECQ